MLMVPVERQVGGDWIASEVYMPLIRSRSHHGGVYKLFQVPSVIREVREISRYSSLFHLIPFTEVFSPAGRLICLYDTHVLAERRRREPLGVVFVRQSIVIVDVVETATFDRVHVPCWRLQPTAPCLTNLRTPRSKTDFSQ